MKYDEICDGKRDFVFLFELGISWGCGAAARCGFLSSLTDWTASGDGAFAKHCVYHIIKNEKSGQGRVFGGAFSPAHILRGRRQDGARLSFDFAPAALRSR
jgi:hypothetical protein